MQLEERKRKRRCEYDCKDHVFYIQTLKANCSKYDIRVQFCPKFQREPLPPEHTYPQYNNDGKYFTSAFVLGVDKRILIKNQQQELMDHQKQIRDSLEKHNQLVFPRPNSKHSLCSVCKEHYRNYYFHISSEEHRERISLSSYNSHILNLCNLYRPLWEGCQEKADEEAERLAIQDEERRLRMAEADPEEEYTNSLLDCQRGDQQRYDENGDLIQRSRHFARRPSSRSFGNDDTITIGRGKRANPDTRSAYEPGLRKHSYHGHFNPAHAARQRKERNYERERMKLMRGTQFQKYKKDFVALPNIYEDVFTIYVPIKGAQSGIVQVPKKISNEKLQRPKKMQEQTPKRAISEQEQQEIQENQSSQSQSQQSQSISQLSSSSREPNKNQEMKMKKKKTDEIEEGELSKSSSSDNEEFENVTKKIGQDDKNYRYEKNTEAIRDNWKIDPRAMPGYGYGYHMPMPPRDSQDSLKYNQSLYKSSTHNKPLNQEYYKYPESSKGMPPPPYYYPYPYPMYDPQYGSMPPSEKGFQSKGLTDKEKVKSTEKNPYEYPMHYSWGYPPPYYMPPPPHNQQGQPEPNPTSQVGTEHLPSQGKSSGTNPNSPYVGSTSININFPMYMCPPPHPSMQGSHYSIPPSRYPVHPQPYMGYQYGPYQDRNRPEGQFPTGSQAQQGALRNSSQYPGYGKNPSYDNRAYYGGPGSQQPSKYLPQAPSYYYPPYMSYHNPQGPYSHRPKSPKRES